MAELQLILNLIGFSVVCMTIIKRNDVEVLFVINSRVYQIAIWLVRSCLVWITFTTDIAAIFVIPLVYWCLKSSSLTEGVHKCLEWMQLTMTLWTLFFTLEKRFSLGMRSGTFALDYTDIIRAFPSVWRWMGLELIERHMKLTKY